MKKLTLFAAVIFLSGCVNPNNPHFGKYTKCKNPRPQMCPMIYAPVCGYPTKKTYSNGCAACSDKHVVFYKKGACK